MKKNGFVSTTVIYTFFILFLLLMVFIMNFYSSTRFLLEQYKIDIKETFAEISAADINLYYYLWSDYTGEYELTDKITGGSNVYKLERYYCKNNSPISYNNNKFTIDAKRKEECYAYFRSKITLKMYTKETATSSEVLVNSLPGYNYKLTSSSCDNGATISFDETTREFSFTNPNNKNNVLCRAVFTKENYNVVLSIFMEDVLGEIVKDGVTYSKVDELPSTDFVLDSYSCKNGTNSRITYNRETGEIETEVDSDNECDVYFKISTNKVDIVLMQESNTGEAGYTTGKSYTKVTSIPTSGYKYIGYICSNNYISLEYKNNDFEVKGVPAKYTVCKAYFNKLSGNADISYYLQREDGSYESVSSIPELGYIYNKDKSSCKNNSSISVNNNIVTINTTSQDECNVYFDRVKAESSVIVNVYVYNRKTRVNELGKVPSDGYTLYSKECTNGASIEILKDGDKLSSYEVKTEGPTVCNLYFR